MAAIVALDVNTGYLGQKPFRIRVLQGTQGLGTLNCPTAAAHVFSPVCSHFVHGSRNHCESRVRFFNRRNDSLKALVSLLILFASAGLACAGEADAQKCRSIAGDADRLACYDAAFPATLPSSDASQWTVSENKSEVDGKKSLYATLFAYSVDGDQTKGKSVRLSLMCSGTFTGVFLATDFYLADLYEMTVRVGDETPSSGVDHWSTYHQTMLALSEPDYIKSFMRSLKDGATVAVRVSTSQDSFEAVFKLGSYEKAADRVATACGWQL
jgi:hypothetical protein